MLLRMKAHALVARNLRKMRVEKGVSQENLAVDADIDRTYVSRLERALENPTIGILERIAEALGTNIEDFFIRPSKGEELSPPLPGGRRKKK